MTTNRLTKNTLTNVQTCISSPLFTVIILPVSECGHLTLHPRCQVIWHSDLWRMPGWLSWALSSDTRPPSAAEAHLWPWDVGLTPDPDLLGTSHCWWRMRRNSRLRNTYICISTYSNSVLFTKNEIFTPLGILLKHLPALRARSGHPGWWCNTQ